LEARRRTETLAAGGKDARARETFPPAVQYLAPLLFLLWMVFPFGTGSSNGAEVESKPCRLEPQVEQWLLVARESGQGFEKRVAHYERVIDACPEDPSLYNELATLVLQHYDFDRALQLIEQGLKKAPQDPDLSLNRAAALLLLGRPADALPSLVALPPSAKGKFYLGLTYRALKDHRAAQETLHQAWNLGYDDPYLLYVSTEQDRILGDRRALSEDFRKLTERFPNSAWPHVAMADGLKAQHQDADAEAEYKKAVALDPNLPFVAYQLGYLAFKRGEYSAASDYFRKEIRLNPSYPAPYVYLGVVLHRLGKNLEALPFLEQGVARAPSSPLAYRELALVQMETNRLEQALKTLRSAEKKFSELPAFPAELSRLLTRMGRPQEAKAEAALAQQLSQKRVRAEEELSGIE